MLDGAAAARGPDLPVPPVIAMECRTPGIGDHAPVRDARMNSPSGGDRKITVT